MTTTELRDKIGGGGHFPHITKISRGKYKGTICFKRYFFYRIGCDAEKFKDQVVSALKKAEIEHEVVDYFEDWNSWPKGSWWKVYIKLI